MSEQYGELRANYAHILTDLHGLAQQLAAIETRLGALEDRLGAVDELLPAAKRAAALFDSPVTGFLAARKEANGGERLVGGSPPERRRRGTRAARR